MTTDDMKKWLREQAKMRSLMATDADTSGWHDQARHLRRERDVIMELIGDFARDFPGEREGVKFTLQTLQAWLQKQVQVYDIERGRWEKYSVLSPNYVMYRVYQKAAEALVVRAGHRFEGCTEIPVKEVKSWLVEHARYALVQPPMDDVKPLTRGRVSNCMLELVQQLESDFEKPKKQENND